MSAPQRRRPGSQSAIVLRPEVEEIRTAGREGVAEARHQLVHEQAPGQAAALEEPAANDNAKSPVTYQLLTSVKEQAETAVLRTSGYDGGYTSFAALQQGALVRELARLAEEFNGGAPFPRNKKPFRRGRPIGS